VRSPVVALHGAPPGREVILKLENLQPVGSFKVRPVGNILLAAQPAELQAGVFTCSSGNSGVALAWMAQRLGLAATVVVPDGRTAPGKLGRLQALGARIVTEPFESWWRAVETLSHPQVPGKYIDAVRDPAALAGNATVALEILEQVPEVEAIMVPLGGGALACGVAAAVRALRPAVKVIACELESAQPFAAALRAGAVTTTRCEPGFVSGVGFASMLPQMWPLCRELIDGTLTVSVAEVAAAIRMMALDNKVIAEGAGAVPVAAALAGRHRFARVCAVVSGGNLDPDMLSTIIAGGIPA
jgi:threonine dehydratase